MAGKIVFCATTFMLWMYFCNVSLFLLYFQILLHRQTHMHGQKTEHKLNHILSHQTSSHCHYGPMGFISASFKTTTLIPTPTLYSRMISMEEETQLA